MKSNNCVIRFLSFVLTICFLLVPIPVYASNKIPTSAYFISAYHTFLETTAENFDIDTWRFGFAYITDDDIPELLVALSDNKKETQVQIYTCDASGAVRFINVYGSNSTIKYIPYKAKIYSNSSNGKEYIVFNANDGTNAYRYNPDSFKTALSDVNIQYGILEQLDNILVSKTYSEPMKQLLRDAFVMLEENYDKAYAYKKMDKSEYLEMFCNAVKDKLDIIEAENMIHELEHINNRDIQAVFGSSGIDIARVIKEGMSARSEDYCDSMSSKNKCVATIDYDTDIVERQETFKLIDDKGITSEFITVYSSFESMVQHLETLLGMNKLNELVHTDGDFVLKLRKELSNKYGKDKTDRFISEFVNVSGLLTPSGVEVTYVDQRYGEVDEYIKFNQNLLNSPPKELEQKLKDKINELEDELVYSEEFRQSIKGSGYDDDFKQKYYDIIDLDNEKINRELKVRRNEIENYNYENAYRTKLEEVRLELSIDQKKLDTFKKYKELGDKVIHEAMIDFESAFNGLMVEKIKGTKSIDELTEIKASCADFYENTIFICIDSRVNITGNNFRDTVVMALQEKEKELSMAIDTSLYSRITNEIINRSTYCCYDRSN